MSANRMRVGSERAPAPPTQRTGIPRRLQAASRSTWQRMHLPHEKRRFISWQAAHAGLQSLAMTIVGAARSFEPRAFRRKGDSREPDGKSDGDAVILFRVHVMQSLQDEKVTGREITGEGNRRSGGSNSREWRGSAKEGIRFELGAQEKKGAGGGMCKGRGILGVSYAAGGCRICGGRKGSADAPWCRYCRSRRERSRGCHLAAIPPFPHCTSRAWTIQVVRPHAGGKVADRAAGQRPLDASWPLPWLSPARLGNPSPYVELRLRADVSEMLSQAVGLWGRRAKQVNDAPRVDQRPAPDSSALCRQSPEAIRTAWRSRSARRHIPLAPPFAFLPCPYFCLSANPDVWCNVLPEPCGPHTEGVPLGCPRPHAWRQHGD